MQETRITALRTQRDELSKRLAMMRETPEDQRPKKKSALAQWLAQVQEVEGLIAQIDAVLVRFEPAPPPETAEAAADSDNSTTVAVIPKGERAELRVCVKAWKGRRVIDVRLWAAVQGEKDKRPSRKGVAFDASKLDALIEALRQAKQYV